MLPLWLLVVFILPSIERGAAYESIQRIDVFDDVVAVASSEFIAVYRFNASNVDYENPLYQESFSLGKVVHLKLQNASTLVYCNWNWCWLCFLPESACLSYTTSDGERTMRSVESAVAAGFLTIRFVDPNGEASTVKFRVSREENNAKGLIRPVIKVNDFNARNATLVGVFQRNGYSYFVGSAFRRRRSPCDAKSECFEENVRISRICNEDETPNLASRVDISLSCRKSTFFNTALASHFDADRNTLTIAFGSGSSSSICEFKVDDLANRFDASIRSCRDAKYPLDCPIAEQSTECKLRMVDATRGYSMCPCVTTTTSCSFYKGDQREHRGGWLENFDPLNGMFHMSLNHGQNDLISVVQHYRSDSLLVHSRLENGSARIDRVIPREGFFMLMSSDPVYPLWSALAVDAVPMVYSSNSNSLLFSRNDSIEIQVISCQSLFRTCEDIPFEIENDPLGCVWCATGEISGFSLAKSEKKSCGDGEIYEDDCEIKWSSKQTTSTVITVTSTTRTVGTTTNAATSFDFGLLLASIGAGIVLIVLVLSVAVYCRCRRGNRASNIESYHLLFSTALQRINRSTYRTSTNYRTLFESFGADKRINYSDLTIDWQHAIGEGHYGQVYKGVCQLRGTRITVACKTLNELRATSSDDFLREAKAMSVLEHPRVLGFVGIFFDLADHVMPTILVTRFMANGDLCQYLRNTYTRVTLVELLNFGLEAAEGMEYIHARGIIHRDLAARNCMLDAHLHVCIADFGLSRFTNEADDGYQVRSNRALPIAMLSIEAIEGFFSVKSDVFAFGNLLWEISTRGHQPWKGISRDELLYRLRIGERLNRQEHCPPRIYREVMLTCWDEEMENRPTFGGIVTTMKEIIGDLRRQQSVWMDSAYEVVKRR